MKQFFVITFALAFAFVTSLFVFVKLGGLSSLVPHVVPFHSSSDRLCKVSNGRGIIVNQESGLCRVIGCNQGFKLNDSENKCVSAK